MFAPTYPGLQEVSIQGILSLHRRRDAMKNRRFEILQCPCLSIDIFLKAEWLAIFTFRAGVKERSSIANAQ
jgi:hypothetical protein